MSDRDKEENDRPTDIEENLEYNQGFCIDRVPKQIGEINEEADIAIVILGNLESNQECSIYRVPIQIRKIKEEAYTPQLISIGPIHHGEKELVYMEEQKSRYMVSFCERITKEKMEEISTFIKKNEDRIRKCFSESFKSDSDVFVSIIRNDAIFIIELFLRYYANHRGDFWLDVPTTKHSLSLDLQLLENQLPYFVLEKICNLAIPIPTFRKLCSRFFEGSLPDPAIEVKHFTDLRRSVLLKSYRGVPSGGSITDLPCAMKMHESGVKFRCIERECLLDIGLLQKPIFHWLKVDELQIPNLQIYDGTECLLRNMMALEQCCYPWDTPLCCYVYLIDSLINTEKDVDLLVEEGIITNCIGDNASVARMFNRLCSHIILSDGNNYNEICEKLKAHCKDPWNHARATLKSVYFSDLWRGTGTVAAVILLLLTFIQTICSIKQVV